MNTSEAVYGKMTLECELGMVGDARWIGHSISEIVGTFDIPRSKMSRVYWECLMNDITTHCRQLNSQLLIFNEHDPRCLARIVCDNK